MEEDFDRELKVLVIGNGHVGKTSMIRRFAKGVYTDEYKKTIGVDFLEKALFVDALGEEVRFMLWDTAGQEEFDAITRTYYRGAGAAVIAFSTTDRASFDAIAMWKSKIENECGDIAMALVQNKVDLIDQAVVTPQEVEGLARKLGLKLYRTCVKENINVTEVFVYLADLQQRKEEAGQTAQQEAADQAPKPERPGGPVRGDSQAAGGGGAEASDDMAAGSGGIGSGRRPAAAAPAGGTSDRDSNIKEERARTVDLGPSKKRTKGKKSLADKMSCSLA